MDECMIHVWGGAWNDDAEPSIKKDYGISEGYYYFKSKKAKNKFLSIIENPVYQEQGIVYDCVSEETTDRRLTHKRTIFVGLYEYQGRRYTIHYDLGFEYPDDSAEYYFLGGDNSCDCNISTIIRWEYGDSAIPQLGCGNEIKLIAYKIEHWNSGYQRYNGDELMRLIANNP